jgi:hypothetical protein
MSGHTPGPWRVKGSGRGLILRIFGGDHDDIDTEIATVFRADHLDYEANAQVMAAAPELLAALILCRSCLNEEVIAAGDLDHPTIRAHAKAAAQADAAIAKAEGRS